VLLLLLLLLRGNGLLSVMTLCAHPAGTDAVAEQAGCRLTDDWCSTVT